MSLAPPGTVTKAPVAEDLEFLTIGANDPSMPSIRFEPLFGPQTSSQYVSTAIILYSNSYSRFR
jgi:hypothetical protein